jgi:Protein of unknown function (DUF973).
MEGDLEVAALQTLRSGFLYFLIAVLLIVVAVFSTLGLLASILLGSAPHGPPPLAAVAAAVPGMMMLLIALAISLYALFGKVRPGMRMLSQVDGTFGICYTGTTFMLVGLVVIVLGLIIGLVALAAAPAGIISAVFLIAGVVGIGAILGIIGDVLTFVVGAFKLHGRYQNTLYMVAGILYVIDLVLALLNAGGILTLVGHVLMYIALGDTVNKLKETPASYKENI